MSKSVRKPRRRVDSPSAVRRPASQSLWLVLASTPAYHPAPGRDLEPTTW